MSKKRVFKSKSKTKGFSFGLTSGVIATLGMIVGLESALNTNVAVIAGILSIAIADSFSDALGIHISEEAEAEHSKKSIWTATIYTFLAKFFFASIFLVPFLIFEVGVALNISIIVGFIIIGVFSYIMAKKQESNPWKAVGEHLLISVIVIVATHFVGDLIGLII